MSALEISVIAHKHSTAHSGLLLKPTAACRPATHGLRDGQGGADVLTLDEPGRWPPHSSAADAFAAQMSLPHSPVVADAACLQQLSLAEVLVRRWPGDFLQAEYFRVMDPAVDVSVGPCGHFFLSVEYEMQSLSQGCRPFSRAQLS